MDNTSPDYNKYAFMDEDLENDGCCNVQEIDADTPVCSDNDSGYENDDPDFDENDFGIEETFHCHEAVKTIKQFKLEILKIENIYPEKTFPYNENWKTNRHNIIEPHDHKIMRLIKKFYLKTDKILEIKNKLFYYKLIQIKNSTKIDEDRCYLFRKTKELLSAQLVRQKTTITARFNKTDKNQSIVFNVKEGDVLHIYRNDGGKFIVLYDLIDVSYLNNLFLDGKN